MTKQARAAIQRWPLGGAALVVVAMVLALRSMGRVWWCQVGDRAIWSGDVWSAHNSQHVFDPYTFTHILHGVIFYWVFRLLFRKRWPAVRFALAVVIECAWEVAENSSAIIDHYRETTMSLDYFGDSVINSLADVLSCVIGFGFASLVPWWGALAFFLGSEALLAWWIRDGLLLNVLMLTFPVEAVKTWQMGLAPPA